MPNVSRPRVMSNQRPNPRFPLLPSTPPNQIPGQKHASRFPKKKCGSPSEPTIVPTPHSNPYSYSPLTPHTRSNRQHRAHRQRRAAEHLHPEVRLVHPAAPACARCAVTLQTQERTRDRRAREDARRHRRHKHTCPAPNPRGVGRDLRDTRGGDGGVRCGRKAESVVEFVDIN